MYYLIIDLEMTGSETGFHEIIEVGAVLADENWKEIGLYETLVYPSNPKAISAESSKIHGITLADLEDAPLPHEMIEDLEDWLREALHRAPKAGLKDVVLCGQSVINDINFLQEEYKKQKLTWPFAFKLIDLLSITFMWYQIFDNNNVPHPKSYSLKAVAEHFDIVRDEDQHNALEDAQMTYKCFRKYMTMLKKLEWKQHD